MIWGYPHLKPPYQHPEIWPSSNRSGCKDPAAVLLKVEIATVPLGRFPLLPLTINSQPHSLRPHHKAVLTKAGTIPSLAIPRMAGLALYRKTGCCGSCPILSSCIFKCRQSIHSISIYRIYSLSVFKPSSFPLLLAGKIPRSVSLKIQYPKIPWHLPLCNGHVMGASPIFGDPKPLS